MAVNVFLVLNRQVPKPLTLDARLRHMKGVGGGALILLLLLMFFCSSRSGKSKVAKSSKADAKAKQPANNDEWLAATLAGTEDRSGKKRSKKKN